MRNYTLFKFLHEFLGEDFNFLNLIKSKDLQTEKVEFIKGNFKTEVMIKFSEDGIPLGCSYTTRYIPSVEEEKLNQLNLQLKEALGVEDYLKAAEVKKQINQLKTNKGTE